MSSNWIEVAKTFALQTLKLLGNFEEKFLLKNVICTVVYIKKKQVVSFYSHV